MIYLFCVSLHCQKAATLKLVSDTNKKAHQGVGLKNFMADFRAAFASVYLLDGSGTAFEKRFCR